MTQKIEVPLGKALSHAESRIRQRLARDANDLAAVLMDQQSGRDDTMTLLRRQAIGEILVETLQDYAPPPRLRDLAGHLMTYDEEAFSPKLVISVEFDPIVREP